jgi:hypothetical protein
MLLRPRATSIKRASEASTSPSGELWDEIGGLQSAIRARDVRAADLQEDPTKPVENSAGFRKTLVSSDPTKTAAPRRTSKRAKRAIRHSERRERSNRDGAVQLASLPVSECLSISINCLCYTPRPPRLTT